MISISIFSGVLLENLQFPEIIRKMEDLTFLQILSFGNVSQTYVKRLASSLPNLEEIHFIGLDMGLTLKNILIPFCQNPKLKTIAIFSKIISYFCTRVDIADINRVRQQFGDDGKLNFYMDKDVIKRINFKLPGKCFVTLKPLSELPREVHTFDY